MEPEDDELRLAERQPSGWQAFGSAAWSLLWKVIWYTVLAIAALFGFIFLVAWAEDNPSRWRDGIFAGLGAMLVWTVNEMRKLLIRIVEQNDELLRRTPRTRPAFSDDLLD